MLSTLLELSIYLLLHTFTINYFGLTIYSILRPELQQQITVPRITLYSCSWETAAQ